MRIPRSVLWKFVAACATVAVLFNLYGTYLEHPRIVQVNPWFIAPFLLLLGSIALLPFLNRKWWEGNFHVVSYTLGIVVAIYYAFSLDNIQRLFLTSYEYISFISLIGSLFVVAGGIHLRIRGRATPLENVALLGTGAVLANLLGTTGASMVLIRPYLRMNKFRIHGYHVVFFIFLVSNIGGALTPIGDPPLFLGYLKGVPFFWIVTRVAVIWAVTTGLVLAMFFVVDWLSFRRLPAELQHAAHDHQEPQVDGLHNIVFLIVIIGAVFIREPLMLREIVMWSAALASYYTTSRAIHEKNSFDFDPIREVAILFAGIFVTMIPALDWLELHAASLGIVSIGQYFWGTGFLSSVLDNAPTYLNFMSAAFGLHGASIDDAGHMAVMLGSMTTDQAGLANPIAAGAQMVTAETWRYVQAISLGAVFFGACTYIGNGPNFMVKTIAEKANVECPTFVGYVVRYTLPVLVPVFLVVWYFFFRT